MELAPLLCAGIIGYRALERTSLPHGGRLGIYGLGGSAHLTAQVAIARGATVHVMTRGEQAQRLALDLGAASATGAYDARSRMHSRRFRISTQADSTAPQSCAIRTEPNVGGTQTSVALSPRG